MKKTIITKEIDGHNIILGFDRPLIDPEATKKVIGPLLDDSDEAKAVGLKTQEIQKLASARDDSLRAAREAFKNKDKSLEAKHSYDVDLRNEQIKQLAEEFVGLAAAVKAKRLGLWNDNLIYFEPKAGEAIIEDDTLPAQFLKLGKKEFLTLEGKVLADKRGVKFVKDGKVLEVKKLGEEPGGALMEDVSPEEFEFMRLDAMSDAERQAEFDAADDGLASQAASMKARLEIKSDPEADAKAKAFYNEGLSELRKKYGIL